jgi:hypothetical protein
MAGSPNRRHTRLIGPVIAVAALFAPFLVGEVTASATPAPPTISNFKAKPASVTTGNGTLTLKATVTNAQTCTLSSNPPVDGLPAAVPCSSVKKVVELPVNTSLTSAVKYKFKLTAQGSLTSTTAKIKVPVEPQSGGYVYPVTITGNETGASGIAGASAYYPFNLNFEFDRTGTCTATTTCDYVETSISGTGGEGPDDPPDTCLASIPISQSGSDLSSYPAELAPGTDGLEHLSFEANTAQIDPNIPGCSVSWSFGFDHSAAASSDISSDVWSPGLTTLSATYDNGSSHGTIDFTFNYA